VITIIDGYVDEPSCLGVPPFISPYIRYICGAIKDAGEDYEYLTIDEWRKGKKINGNVLIIYGGAVIPGKYLRGMPISFKEFLNICYQFKGIKILCGSCAKFGFGQGGGKNLIDGGKFVDYCCKGDDDAFVYDFINGEISNRKRKKEEWKKWSVLGAELVKHHPDFPQPLIAEIETYRGCVRWFKGGCSFCIEPSFGRPEMRDERDIINEIRELAKIGVKNFRLGCQTCFFSYKARGIGKSELPKPNVDAIKRLLEGISNVKPQILHIDNVNPAIVAEWEDESRKIAKIIVKYCSPGNTAAFGMESADERVIEENNLNAKPEQVLKAIEIINEEGKETGENGMPYFLPGINILFGLKGESKRTYDLNLNFLREIINRNLLLRRINIRQVVYFGKEKARVNVKLFKKFKRIVNEEINKPMLKKILPKKSILKNVFLEINIGKYTFGRQIGSYPVLVCLPYKTNLNRFVDVKISDHGYRSVTGIEYPLNINKVSYDILKNVPKLKNKAADIIKNRPFKDINEIKRFGEEILEWFVI
jgi:radical SAM superfamily enzyme with C-terminal helix-hairpin-helix motif